MHEDFGVHMKVGRATKSVERRPRVPSAAAALVGGPTPAPTHTYNKPYGWYACDTTPHMLDKMMNAALSLHTYDAIIITGDFVAHNQVRACDCERVFLSGLLQNILYVLAPH